MLHVPYPLFAVLLALVLQYQPCMHVLRNCGVYDTSLLGGSLTTDLSDTHPLSMLVLQPKVASTSTPASSSAAKSSSNSWGALPSAAASSSPSRASTSAKQQQSFDAVMGFDGLAPELINGRAASEFDQS
jgi:hypothetical protein